MSNMLALVGVLGIACVLCYCDSLQSTPSDSAIKKMPSNLRYFHDPRTEPDERECSICGPIEDCIH